MARALYFLLTFLESGLAVFGIRAPFEEPSYRIEATLAPGVEVRAYGPLVAAETRAADSAAFSRLFNYIAGANGRDQTIAMTAPVEQRGRSVSIAGPAGAEPMMRFYLPAAIARDPPPPADPQVRIVRVPARTIAAIRFSGRLDRRSIEAHAATLRSALAAANRKTAGDAYVLGYDPPFTIPALRRNEVAVDLEP